MYELYFDNPITMIDSFFVGIKYQCGRYVSAHRLRNAPIDYFMISNRDTHAEEVKHCHYRSYTLPGTDSIVAEWTNINQSASAGGYLFIFPILALPDDTINNPTVGIENMIQRLITISPNPAHGNVKVLSSFGLQKIETFNTAGKMVFSDEADGYSSTIDVTSWPKGPYVLRITTPMGTTTKKLLVN